MQRNVLVPGANYTRNLVTRTVRQLTREGNVFYVENGAVGRMSAQDFARWLDSDTSARDHGAFRTYVTGM